MTREQILSEMQRHDPFDGYILRHGFTKSFRDYEVAIAWIPKAGMTSTYLYSFLRCVCVSVENVMPRSVFTTSLDDRLLTLPDSVTDDSVQDGYVWGVNSLVLYPGWTLVLESSIAKQWSEKHGVTFCEMMFETNIQRISVVFMDLTVEPEEHTLHSRT